MRTSTSALFLIMLTSFVFASQENLLELMDQSPEGRDILNAIYLQLHTVGPNLQRGKIVEALTVVKQNAAKSERRQLLRIKRLRLRCRNDRALLRKHVNENERHEFTVGRHINANSHARRKNQQFIDRSKAEWNSYEALRNLLIANRAKWNGFVQGRLTRINTVIRLLRKARRHLVVAHKAALGAEFVEMKQDTISALSELTVEFTNTEDGLDGLRPIISNLLQSARSPPVVGKNVIRARLIHLLKTIIKVIRKRRDLLEQQNEGANSLFEALLKSFDENKTRVTKLLERLAHEKNLLDKRQGALNDALARAHRISVLSKKAAGIRVRQCRRTKVRNARLHVRLQKIKNIVAQIEEILQERFGKLRAMLLERRMKFDDKQ